MEDMDLRLMQRSALPIDDIDQLLMPPNDGMSIIWADISERPDLAKLSERSTQESSYAVCTWFYGNPGKRNMLVGLRVAMKQPTKAVFVLVFKVDRCVDQLSTIACYGKLWIVPGSPPAHLVGTQEMDVRSLQNWKEPETSTISLANGEEARANVNGISPEDGSGFVLVHGRDINQDDRQFLDGLIRQHVLSGWTRLIESEE